MASGILDLPQFTWRPLPAKQAMIVPSIMIAHTAVSGARSLYDYFNGPSGGIEAHCYIRADGTAEQYIAADERADANGGANRWFDRAAGVWRGAFSCETYDNGNPAIPWTQAQINTLADVAGWLHQRYGVPLTVCTSPTSPGLGWHSMWPNPNPWSPGNHTCPGSVRIAQFRNQLLPLIERRNIGRIMAVTPTLTEIENYVVKSYQAAGNTDTRGQRYWVRTAGAASDPFAIFEIMDKALGLS